MTHSNRYNRNALKRRGPRIANPYFIPDENAIEILVAAKKRGVDVKIMVAGKHDENNVSVYDRAFAAKWEEIFHRDLANCRRVDIKDWRNRGWFTKLRELLYSFFRDQV